MMYLVNERWNEVKSIIKKSAKKNIAHKKRQKARKPWVTTQMLDKMDLRRKWKNVNTIEGKKEYKRLNNELRRVTERAREQWWNDQCAELEKLDKKGKSDLVYNKVRELCGVKRKNKEEIFINDTDGKLLTEPEPVKERWKEYIEELYAKDEKPREIELEKLDDIDPNSIGPSVMRREVEKALEEMKAGKSEGVDEIPAEMLQQLGVKGVMELTDLCVLMYEKGEVD